MSSAFSNFEVSIILQLVSALQTTSFFEHLRSLQIYRQILLPRCSFMTRIRVKAFTKDGQIFPPHPTKLPPPTLHPSSWMRLTGKFVTVIQLLKWFWKKTIQAFKIYIFWETFLILLVFFACSGSFYCISVWNIYSDRI